MDQFLRNRGFILTCFAQFEWFMAKILVEAHAFPEYHDLNLDFSIQAETRARKIRVLFGSEGRLKKYSNEFLPLVDKIMEYSETRNFMAHGVAITTPSAEHGVFFRMKIFKRMTGSDDHEGKIDFTVEQLTADTEAIGSATKEFISTIKKIWNEQGMKNFDVEF
jgi:hypothetical protein